MTLYQFNLLDEMEQQEAIWEGTLIANRIEGEYKLLLYQIDSFYVEVWYHVEHNVVKRYRSFSSMEKLQPYTMQIDIKGLIL
ncbi:MAG: hypothetical protein JWP69_1697 [Flaviaesturariibacter sp.]|nr:hypothetical protein [Flaviaesturariibacter sp.]